MPAMTKDDPFFLAAFDPDAPVVIFGDAMKIGFLPFRRWAAGHEIVFSFFFNDEDTVPGDLEGFGSTETFTIAIRKGKSVAYDRETELSGIEGDIHRREDGGDLGCAAVLLTAESLCITAHLLPAEQVVLSFIAAMETGAYESQKGLIAAAFRQGLPGGSRDLAVVVLPYATGSIVLIAEEMTQQDISRILAMFVCAFRFCMYVIDQMTGDDRTTLPRQLELTPEIIPALFFIGFLYEMQV